MSAHEQNLKRAKGGGSAAEQAQQLLELSTQLDASDRTRGAQPIFAIDSNVIQFLSQPSERAKSEERDGKLFQGLGAIFNTDPEPSQELIAHALAEHLLIQLRVNAPILVIPPVTRELHDFARSLSRGIVTPYRSDLQISEARAVKLLDQLESLGAFGDKAPPLIQQVQEVLFLRYGPPAAARRLKHLLASRHVVNSDLAAQQPDLRLPDPVRLALHPFRFGDSASASRRADDWLHAGIRTANRHRLDAERRDAALLVRLEQINGELAGLSDWKIVYVSADRNLLNVVQSAGDPLLEVHHPRAWLTRLDIFSQRQRATTAEDDQATSLADFLKLVAYDPEPASETADQSVPLKEWNDYLRTATAAFTPRPESKDLYFDEASDMLRRYAAGVERFHTELVELQTEAWETCFEATAITAATEAQKTERDYARSVPILVFEEWFETDRAIRQFLEWHTPEDFDVKTFRAGLEKIDRDDPTGYARYVALATIFASRGEWEVAYSLIRRAFEAKAEGASRIGGPNGREASFLEAVCLRHLVTSPTGLDPAERLVARAEQITIAEYGTLDAAARVVPERYAGERLANRISRFYFERYADGESAACDDQETLSLLVTELHALLDKTMHRLNESPAQQSALQQLGQRTIINILGLAVFATRHVPAFELVYEEAERQGLTEAWRERRVSALARLTVLAYRRIVRGERSVHLRDALSLLLAETEQNEKMIVFPYDKARFAELKRKAFSR